MYDVDAAPGDVLVLATDGVLDNMWPDELEGLVSAHVRMHGKTEAAASRLAAALVAAASRNGGDPGFRSPWIVEAAAAGVLPLWARLAPRGGKLDDCTAVVAFLEAAEG